MFSVCLLLIKFFYNFIIFNICIIGVQWKNVEKGCKIANNNCCINILSFVFHSIYICLLLRSLPFFSSFSLHYFLFSIRFCDNSFTCCFYFSLTAFPQLQMKTFYLLSLRSARLCLCFSLIFFSLNPSIKITQNYVLL